MDSDVPDSRYDDERDRILLTDYSCRGIVGRNGFGQKGRLLPLLVSVAVEVPWVRYDDAADAFSVSYGDLARAVERELDGRQYESIAKLAQHLQQHVSPKPDRFPVTYVCVKSLEASLCADYVSVEYKSGKYSTTFKGITVQCIIGIYDHEREYQQPVVIDLNLESDEILKDTGSYGLLEWYPSLQTHLVQTKFLTLEALAVEVARKAALEAHASHGSIIVNVSKPRAVAFAAHAGVRIKRKLDHRLWTHEADNARTA
ncbi:Tudor domain-containing protein 1 [Savitreella phatthalungensis]